MNRSIVYLFFSTLLLITSCKPASKITQPNTNTDTATTEKEATTLPDLVHGSAVFNKIFTGFVLHDPVENKTLFEQYPDKYFTPASNTKILTLYTCLKVLGDSIPALKYYVSNDSLFFWGTGDPALLNPNLKGNTNRVIDFLKTRNEKLFYIPQNIGGKFGDGWAWDDYDYTFSTQKHAMPIYGNLVRVNKRKGKTATTTPKYFEQFLKKSNYTYNGASRAINDNTITYSYKSMNSAYTDKFPMHITNAVVIDLLRAATGKTIQLKYNNLKFFKTKAKTIYSISTDEALKKMMLPSDNFIAEQLLLVCASTLDLPLNTKKVIEHAKKNIFKNMPSGLAWRDGSGLSRYNLFTPRSMVKIVDNLYQEFKIERILSLFPAGGKSGTLRRWYKGETPYVFAKTGTMSNKHCLTGFVKTNDGRTLIFSFMHNNYIGSSTPVKKEMQKILEFIRDNGAI